MNLGEPALSPNPEEGLDTPLNTVDKDALDKLNYREFKDSLYRLLVKVIPEAPSEMATAQVDKWFNDFQTKKSADEKIDLLYMLGSIFKFLENQPGVKLPIINRGPNYKNNVISRKTGLDNESQIQFQFICLAILPKIFPADISDEELIAEGLMLVNMRGNTILFSQSVLGSLFDKLAEKIKANSEEPKQEEVALNKVEKLNQFKDKMNNVIADLEKVLNEAKTVQLNPQSVNIQDQVNKLKSILESTDLEKMRLAIREAFSKLPRELVNNQSGAGYNQRWEYAINTALQWLTKK